MCHTQGLSPDSITTPLLQQCILGKQKGGAVPVEAMRSYAMLMSSVKSCVEDESGKMHEHARNRGLAF